MSELNVSQPSPQIGVGFGAVVKFQEIYVLHVEAQNILDPTLAAPLALGDLLSYSGENKVLPAISGDGFKPAGFAAYEGVVNSTGVWGYKPQAGDPIGVYKQGRYKSVNVDGIVAAQAQLVVGTVAGSVRSRPGGNTDPTVGIALVGNAGVAGGPIEVELNTMVVQKVG